MRQAVVDALGLPVRLALGLRPPRRLLPAPQVIADRAYDADRLHDLILEQGGEPIIPSHRHRKHKHRYDHRF